MLIVEKDVLDVPPFDLVCELISVFNIEDDLFYRNSPVDLRVFDSGLIYECSVAVVVLDLKNEWSHVDHLISEGVEGRKYIFELFPILFTKDASLFDSSIISFVILDNVGSVDEEKV